MSSTFFERFTFYAEITNPRFLLVTDADILEAQQALAKDLVTDSDSTAPRLSQAEIARYEGVVNSAIHAASGDTIAKPLRVSAIGPVNIPIILLMLMCPPSNVPGTLFLHLVNQSYNSLCNYAHRSGKDFDFDNGLQAYSLAVGSACSFAYGLGKLAAKMPPSIQRFNMLIPMLATSAANASNLGFTRSGEIFHGTLVTDHEGKDRGLSKVAGIDGIVKTAMTRGVLVPASCLAVPPLLEHGLKKIGLFPRGKAAGIIAQCGLIYLSMQCALPAALAVFPAKTNFNVSDLEPEFQQLVDSEGNKIRHLTASKGL